MDNKLTDTEIQDMLKQYPLGNIESPTDLRDYTYDMISEASNIEIPNEFEVEYQFEAKNQGQIGACVNHAISSVKEIIDGVTEYYSQWWLHALRSDSDFQGKGAIIREELQHLVNDGIVQLNLFNVSEEYSQIRDTLETKYNKDHLLKEAAKHKSTGYIKLNSDEIKRYLYSEKKPIILAVNVYQNFYEAQYNNGVIPSMPQGSSYGRHAMAIVGYKGDILKILNSWGQWGGQNGYLYLDINSPIIKELWGLTDKPIEKPPVNKYRVGWDKEASTGKWIYSEDGLNLIKDTWKQIKGIWYYFKDIYAIDGEWIKDNEKWYYLEKGSCAMATDRWIYWIDKWYRVGEDGAMIKGWYQDYSTNWYYLGIDQGYAYANCTILIDGKNYSFNSSGALINNNCVSDDLFNFIKAFEGCYLSAYYCPSHVLTIGIGNTNPKWTSLETITETQAMEAFEEDMQTFADGVDKLASNAGVSLNNYQREALISFSFNVGLAALESSTLWKNICNGVTDPKIITENFSRWNKDSYGNVLHGLSKRRSCEANLFLNGDYSLNN